MMQATEHRVRNHSVAGNQHRLVVGLIGVALDAAGFGMAETEIEVGERFVDIGKTGRILLQVGKQTKRGLPVLRERRALCDIGKEAGGVPLKFIPHN